MKNNHGSKKYKSFLSVLARATFSPTHDSGARRRGREEEEEGKVRWTRKHTNVGENMTWQITNPGCLFARCTKVERIEVCRGNEQCRLQPQLHKESHH